MGGDTTVATLLERLSKQLGAGSGSAEGVGETERASQLLRARSGRATSGRGPLASAVGEKQAVAGTQAALDQQKLQGTLAGEQLSLQSQTQEEQAARQLTGAQLTNQAVVNRLAQQEDAILGEFERGSRRLDSDRDAAALEQVGFSARLKNKQYIDNLQREGTRQRLSDEARFRVALQESVFGELRNLFQDDLQFRELMAADDATFERELGDMNINYALEVANNAAKEQNTRAVFEGIGTAVSGGAQAYDTYTRRNPTTPNTSGGEGNA